MIQSVVNTLFTEKFRPKKLEHLILPERVRSQLSQGLVQNILFYGSPGTGKTSAMFIISSTHPSIYINASSERGIDVIREKIRNFCSSISLDEGKETLKCVILDECLEENEKVRIGKIDEYDNISLKDLKKGEIYPCLSLNMETKKIENDTCEIISEREAEIFEVELEDGRKIYVTSNHPFLQEDNNIIIEKSLEDGINEGDYIITF